MIKRSFNFFLIIFLTLLIANTNVFAFHKKKGLRKPVFENLSQEEVQSKYCTNDVKKKFLIKENGRKAKDDEGNTIQKVNEDGIPEWTIKDYHEAKPKTLKELFSFSESKELFNFSWY